MTSLPRRYFHACDSKGHENPRHAYMAQRAELQRTRDIARQRCVLSKRFPFVRNSHERATRIQKDRRDRRRRELSSRMDKYGVKITLQWNRSIVGQRWRRWHAHQLLALKVPLYVETIPRQVRRGDKMIVYIQALYVRKIKQNLLTNRVLRLLPHECENIDHWVSFKRQYGLIRITENSTSHPPGPQHPTKA